MVRNEFDVFLSYRHEDTVVARKLAQELRALGRSVWLGHDQIKSDESVPEAVANAMASSSVLVVLVSQGALTRWQLAELAFLSAAAQAADRPIVPVVLEGRSPVKLPAELSRYRAVSVGRSEGLFATARKISDVLGGSTRSGGSSGPLIRRGIPRIDPAFVPTAAFEEVVGALRAGESPIWVVGKAGSGKTTAVAAACREVLSESQLVWWVSSHTTNMVVAELAALADALGLGETDLEQAARSALEYLSVAPDAWVIVYDDVSVSVDIESWLPLVGNGSSIVVSRGRLAVSKLRGVGKTVRLSSLTHAESALLLDRLIAEHRLPSPNADDASTLVRSAGGSPLVLSLLAGTVAQSGRLGHGDILAARGDDTFVGGPSRLVSLDVFMRSLDVTVGRVSTLYPEALQILAAIAWGAKTPLLSDVIVDVADDTFLASTRSRAIATLSELERSGILELSDTAIEVHDLVRFYARRSTDLGPARFLARALSFAFKDAQHRQHWPRLVTLIPHVRELLLVASSDEGRGSPGLASEPQLWQLLIRSAGFLSRAGDVAEGMDLLERAVAASIGLPEVDALSSLDLRANLAAAYGEAGRLEEAIALYEQVLADRRAAFGDDHPTTLSTQANLASVLLRTGRLEEAIALLGRAAADSARLLGQGHPSSLTLRANLAAAYGEAGRVEEAIALYEQVLADSERVLGSLDPFDNVIRNNLEFLQAHDV